MSAYERACLSAHEPRLQRLLLMVDKALHKRRQVLAVIYRVPVCLGLCVMLGVKGSAFFGYARYEYVVGKDRVERLLYLAW